MEICGDMETTGGAKRIAVIVDNRRWRDREQPERCAAAGLRRLGYRLQLVTPGAWPIFRELPDAALIWNGVHGRRRRIVGELRDRGVPVLIMEHGFFDRFRYTQIDHAGFAHRASWAASLHGPAPPAGPARFARAWGGPPVRTEARKSGYILVLAQVPGDAQLADSKIHHPGPLVQALEDAAPGGARIRVRPHPRSAWRPRTRDGARVIGGPLEDAVAGARFVVTINSNAGNEAIARGCPVMCLGPALYGMAGAALTTGLAGLREAIETMLDGWRPDDRLARDYLYNLACRQWSRRELRDGKVLSGLLSAAGQATGATHEL